MPLMSCFLKVRLSRWAWSFGLLAAVGCSSSNSASSKPGEAGAPPSDAAILDRDGADAGAGETDAGDAQMGTEASASCAAQDGGGACNTLPATGQAVSATCGGEPPTMTGGSISDGEYVLTAETRYGCPDGGLGGLPAIDAAIVTIHGSCIEGIRDESGQTFTYGATLSVQGNALTETAVCSSLIGGFSTTSATFTATPATLSVLLPYVFPELQVYTKR